MNPIHFSRFFVFATMLLSLNMAVYAEKADRNKPFNLEADSAVYDDVKQVMVARGQVIISKGTMVLRSATLEQREDREGNQFFVALAKPGERVFFRQKREGIDEFMEGEAERIEYDGRTEILKLSGQAAMRRLRGVVPSDEALGNLIVYNSLTETMSVTGSPATAAKPAQRVRMVLSPKQVEKTPAAEPQGRVLLRGATQLKPP